jgi:hypothetical protein
MSGCASGGGGQASQTEGEDEEAAEGFEEIAGVQMETRIWKVTDEVEPDPLEEWWFELQMKMGPNVDEPDTAIVWPQEYEGPYFYDDTPVTIFNFWDYLTFWYSRSQFAGDTPPGFSSFNLMVSFHDDDENFQDYIGLYYGRGRAARGRELQDGLDQVSEAGFEVGWHFFMTPEHYPIKVYWIFGARYGWLFWSQSGSSDVVGTGIPYLGVGASLLQSGKFSLGINVTVGQRITNHRYEGELFTPIVTESKVSIEINFSLK